MDKKLKDKIIAEAQRIEEDSLHSAKRHFEAARLWTNSHLCLGIPAAVLAALSGTSAFSNHTTTAGVLAIIVTALATVITFLNPSERAKIHMDAGNSYNALRNQARIFYGITCADPELEEGLPDKLAELSKQRDDLNSASPITPRIAFQRSRQGIEEGEAQYKVDKKKK